jgi:hypothetical protein
MISPIRATIVLAALVLLAATLGAETREITCFVVVEEGASAEANSLYLRKMGVDPEVLKTFAPSRFTAGPGAFKAIAQGQFSYEAGTPVLRDRAGKLALYEVPLKISAAPPPKAQATVSVRFGFKELASAKGSVQPALRAMQLAAAKAGMKSGIAWIVEMSLVDPGMLSATVGLSR